MIGDLAGVQEEDILALGYVKAKPIARNLWVAVGPVAFGTGLYVIEDYTGWQRMWFYPNEWAAESAFNEIASDWDGQSSDPPGSWIKAKPSQRLGPGYDLSAVQITFALSIGQHSDSTDVGMFANAHEATDEAQRVCGVVFPPDALLRLDRERNRSETVWHSGPTAERWARVVRTDLRP